MLKALKYFFSVFFNTATLETSRENRKLHIFDLVSMVEHPTPKDVYMVYGISDTTVYLIKWPKYFHLKTNLFNASPNDQVCYSHWQIQDNVYKIKGYSITPYMILLHSSKAEFRTFVSRFQDVFFSSLPLLGKFLDKDGHTMLITDVVNGLDGHSVVYDLTTAPTAGILHFHQVAHSVRTKDLINNQVIRPLDPEDVMNMINKPWRKEVLESLVGRMFAAVRNTEMKGARYDIFCKGLTECNRNPKSSTTIDLKNEIKT